MASLQATIQILKTATGLIFSQKNFAVYKEIGYEEPNGLLNELGVNTNQFLGGLFSGSTEEVLRGGKIGSSIDEFLSYLIETEPISCTISQPTRVFEHPLETNIGKGALGSQANQIYASQQNFIADHSIVLPISINVQIAFPRLLFRSVDKELNRMNKEKWLLAIVSRANVYHNMIVENFSHSEEPNTIDRMIYTINFREIQAQYPLANIVKKPDDKSV